MSLTISFGIVLADNVTYFRLKTQFKIRIQNQILKKVQGIIFY
jgi:hypothetical protein